MTPEEEVLAKDITADCMEWDGYIDRLGYGRCGREYAHRVAYREAH